MTIKHRQIIGNAIQCICLRQKSMLFNASLSYTVDVQNMIGMLPAICSSFVNHNDIGQKSLDPHSFDPQTDMSKSLGSPRSNFRTHPSKCQSFYYIHTIVIVLCRLWKHFLRSYSMSITVTYTLCLSGRNLRVRRSASLHRLMPRLHLIHLIHVARIQVVSTCIPCRRLHVSCIGDKIVATAICNVSTCIR